jgi:hypothetical protein
MELDPRSATCLALLAMDPHKNRALVEVLNGRAKEIAIVMVDLVADKRVEVDASITATAKAMLEWAKRNRTTVSNKQNSSVAEPVIA